MSKGPYQFKIFFWECKTVILTNNSLPKFLVTFVTQSACGKDKSTLKIEIEFISLAHRKREALIKWCKGLTPLIRCERSLLLEPSLKFLSNWPNGRTDHEVFKEGSQRNRIALSTLNGTLPKMMNCLESQCTALRIAQLSDRFEWVFHGHVEVFFFLKLRHALSRPATPTCRYYLLVITHLNRLFSEIT